MAPLDNNGYGLSTINFPFNKQAKSTAIFTQVVALLENHCYLHRFHTVSDPSPIVGLIRVKGLLKYVTFDFLFTIFYYVTKLGFT